MHQLFEPTLAQLASAIAWLAQRGISASRLASVFGTTPGHIRVLAHRGQRRNPKRHEVAVAIPGLGFEPSAQLCEQLRIRSQPEEEILTRTMQARTDWLEHEIASRLSTYSGRYRFLEGAASLRALRQYVGYPANALLIGLLARLHQYTAWFDVHSGLSTRAVAEAAKGYPAFRNCVRRIGSLRSQHGIYAADRGLGTESVRKPCRVARR